MLDAGQQVWLLLHDDRRWRRWHPRGRRGKLGQNDVDSHLKELRRKLSGVAPGRELVHSVYGVGYRYEVRER